MKKKLSMLAMAFALSAALAGCSGGQSAQSGQAETAVKTAAASGAENEAQNEAETEAAEDAGATSPEEAPKGADSGEAGDITPEDVTVRVGSLKGPTSMGLVYLMDQADKGEAGNKYEFTMAAAADELAAKIAARDLDIALVPANVASVLCNKTQGGVSVIDINTLGVLDIVSSDDSISGIADLKGRTIVMTGKGTTPDYVIRYLLDANGLSESDVTLEYKSEPAEVAAFLKEQPELIGLLPQPFVTAACAQNDALKIVLDLTDEWDHIQGESGSRLVTGVTIVRSEFLEENPNAVSLFIKEHFASADFANAHTDEASELVAAQGIIEKAPVAKLALPYCNIVCITGDDMKAALSGYLQVLFDQDPASVGGKLPEDSFYFIQ